MFKIIYRWGLLRRLLCVTLFLVGRALLFYTMELTWLEYYISLCTPALRRGTESYVQDPKSVPIYIVQVYTVL